MAQTLVSHTSHAQPADEPGCGYYLYGVMQSEALPPVLPDAGVDAASSVYALSHAGLAAILSRVSLGDWEQEPLTQRLGDMAWVETRVRAHAAVVETICRSATMVPMRFCSIFRTEERVREMLTEHYGYFAEALDRFAGKHEWGVKLSVDRECLAQTVEGLSDAVRDLKARLAAASPGAAYLERKRLERAAAEAATEAIDECAGRTHERLAAWAEDAVLRTVDSPAAEDPHDELVLNAAYLVLRDRRPEFEAELDGLREGYGPLGFTYDLTGPWPPYSFAGAPGEGGRTGD